MNTTAPHGAIGSRARHMRVLDVYGLYPPGSEMCSVPCDLQGNSHTCSTQLGAS